MKKKSEEEEGKQERWMEAKATHIYINDEHQGGRAECMAARWRARCCHASSESVRKRKEEKESEDK